MRSMFSLSSPMAAATKRIPSPVLLLDPPQIFFSGGAVVTGVCRLAVGHQDQQLQLLRAVRQALRHKRRLPHSGCFPGRRCPPAGTCPLGRWRQTHYKSRVPHPCTLWNGRRPSQGRAAPGRPSAPSWRRAFPKSACSSLLYSRRACSSREPPSTSSTT